MAEGVAQITTRVSNLETRMQANEKQVADHDEWINGNGKEGAKTRLATLEKGLGRIEEQLNKITNWIIGLFVTLIGGFLMYFFTSLLPQIITDLGK